MHYKDKTVEPIG
jgi:hypothetical protein